ncbi:MAG: hypothetical protein ACRC14_04925, partial [Paracoccaceae bacterium]
MSSIPGNTTTSEILSVNEIVTSTIDTSTDTDWFRVRMVSGLTYSFTVEGNGGPGIGLPDPDIFLYNGSGAFLFGSTNFNDTSNTIRWNAGATGDYFIEIRDLPSGDTGGYRLSWVATDNILNNTLTTRTMLPGQTVSSRIDVAGDRDWIKVTMTEGLSYGFLGEAGGGADLLDDIDLVLYNASGNAVATSSNFNNTSNALNVLINVSGTYFIEASDINGNLDTGSYNLSWVTSDNVVNNSSTSRTLASNTSTTSRIDVAGDSDWFKVTLVEGINYGFQVANDGAGGLSDGDVFLRNASGNIVASGVNFNDSVFTLGHTASASGVYFVEINANGDGDVGAYILRNLGLDTTVRNAATNLSLSDGARISGRIDVEGDSDWVKFSAEQGVSYQFQLSGNGSAAGLDLVRLI